MNESILENLQKFKLPIGLSLIGVVLIIGGVFASGLTNQKPKGLPASRQDFPKESLVQPQTQKLISVDVSGAVNKSGVYQLNADSRIEDAISAAGGFAQNSNQEYISKYLNMAQKLSDGTKIYVPAVGEDLPAGQTGTTGAVVSAKININTASESELDFLSGVGPATAAKIISGRPYGSIEDLLAKKVVTKSVFDKIKDSLVLY